MGKMTIWGTIDAQPIFFPAVAEPVNGTSLQFAVSADAARSLLPGDAFEIVEPEPGVATVIISALEMRGGEWGASNTFDVAVIVRPAGSANSAKGLFLSPAPMSPTFGREAAHRALGFPKLEGTIDVAYTDDSVTFRAGTAGASDVVLRFPRVRSDAPPMSAPTVVYTHRDGEPYAAPVQVDLFTSVVDPERVEIEVGTGPLSDLIRHLDLPRVPQAVLWGERGSVVFDLPEPYTPADAPAEAEAETQLPSSSR